MRICLYHHLAILYFYLDFKTSEKISNLLNVFYAVKYFYIRIVHSYGGLKYNFHH